MLTIDKGLALLKADLTSRLVKLVEVRNFLWGGLGGSYLVLNFHSQLGGKLIPQRGLGKGPLAGLTPFIMTLICNHYVYA